MKRILTAVAMAASLMTGTAAHGSEPVKACWAGNEVTVLERMPSGIPYFAERGYDAVLIQSVDPLHVKGDIPQLVRGDPFYIWLPPDLQLMKECTPTDAEQ